MSVIEVAIGYGSAPGQFRVDVRSPAGDMFTRVNLDAEMLFAGRAQFQQTLLVSGVAARQFLSKEERAVRETGEVLFSALLGAGEVAGLYRASTALAEERGEELRIVMRLDATELMGLPWEAMYDPVAGGYVCRQHQLVRYIPVAAVPPPLEVRLPLRVLGVVSAPRGLPTLDSVREQEQLTRALAGLAGQGLAELTWAPSATWDDLHEMLLAGPWHVLHFIGHGDFDPERDEGILALAREDGRADLVEASRFTSLLRQARPVPRLVVLNSCSGAATGTSDVFSGTAAALARSGVGAVTAMQYAISDTAAVAFARGFYAALAHGRGVDEAVSAGRIGILGTSGQTLEWITPVMYLRGHDARLFTLPATGEPRRATEPAPAEPAPAVAAAARTRPAGPIVCASLAQGKLEVATLNAAGKIRYSYRPDSPPEESGGTWSNWTTLNSPGGRRSGYDPTVTGVAASALGDLLGSRGTLMAVADGIPSTRRAKNAWRGMPRPSVLSASVVDIAAGHTRSLGGTLVRLTGDLGRSVDYFSLDDGGRVWQGVQTSWRKIPFDLLAKITAIAACAYSDDNELLLAVAGGKTHYRARQGRAGWSKWREVDGAPASVVDVACSSLVIGQVDAFMLDAAGRISYTRAEPGLRAWSRCHLIEGPPGEVIAITACGRHGIGAGEGRAMQGVVLAVTADGNVYHSWHDLDATRQPAWGNWSQLPPPG